MKILLFGGTTEGRILTERLLDQGHELTVCVATLVGEEELTRSDQISRSQNLTILRGRLNKMEIEGLLPAFSLCIDATHPYAQQISETLSECCAAQQIPLKQILRQESKTEGCTLVSSAEEASRLLSEDPRKDGNILLTTGAKELPFFQKLPPERLYVRVLPTQEGIASCEQLGLKHRQILAMQGPYTRDFNEAVIRQFHIRYLVTKDGGKAGGLEEKITAAAACGVEVILIRRPQTAAASSIPQLTVEQMLAGTAAGGTGDGPCVPNDAGPAAGLLAPFDDGTTVGPCISPVEDGTKEPSPVPRIERTYVILVGCGCGWNQVFPNVQKEICRADWVVGAGRLLENIPVEEKKKYAAVRTEDILKFIRNKQEEAQACRIVAAFSGDTGFYSGAVALGRLLDQEKIEYQVIPGISSLQVFAARLKRPWQEWTLCSAHGRECDPVQELQKGKPVFLLTGSAQDTGRICSRLTTAGLGDCHVTVGEALGTPKERIISGTAKQMQGIERNPLHVMLLELPKELLPAYRTPGIPDDQFLRNMGKAPGNPVPMTKQEVRAVILSKLGIRPTDICWDIGAGTGSVSVEMAMAGSRVYAVEYKKEAISLIEQNRKKFCAWNLEIISGRAPEILSSLPVPDVVFVGGSSGNMPEILTAAVKANPHVRICISAVTLETAAQVLAWAKEQGWRAEVTQVSVSRSRPAADAHMMTANNPVNLITLSRDDRGQNE